MFIAAGSCGRWLLAAVCNERQLEHTVDLQITYIPPACPPSPAVALLEAGLAKLHPAFDPYSTPGGRELEAAQSKARAAKLKVRAHRSGWRACVCCAKSVLSSCRAAEGLSAALQCACMLVVVTMHGTLQCL